MIEFVQLSVAFAVLAAFDCIGICGESVPYCICSFQCEV